MTTVPPNPPLPGLLWAMSFDARGCGHPIVPGEPLPDLDAFGEGFVWLHFDLKAADYRQWYELPKCRNRRRSEIGK